MDQDDRQATLAAGQEDEVRLSITDVDSPVTNLRKYMLLDSGKSSMEQMNLLAQTMEVMSDYELQIFSGALNIEAINGMEDIQRITDSLDNYELFPDVGSEKELGVYLVESGDVEIHESALKYMDYSRIGIEYYANHSCAYTGGGLVVKKEETSQYHTVIFDLQITSPYYTDRGAPPLRLTLPAPEEKLGRFAEKLHLANIYDCDVMGASSPIADLNKLTPLARDILKLNELADDIARLSQTDGGLTKLCAVLEAEKPDAVGSALKIVRSFEDYELLKRDIWNAGDYGYHVLYDSDPDERGIDFQEEVKDFIDFEKYGEWRMEEDGVQQTVFGLVRRISEPFTSQASDMVGMSLE